MIHEIFALALALTSQSSASFDPNVEWKTLTTEHFYIHFDPETREAANRLAVRAEKAYDVVTSKFQWEPSSKTHLVLSDMTDDANGLSTPLPYNTIYLYAAPPADGSALDYYDDWLQTLIIHEFTHTVHIDMARGLNKIPRAILGRFWLPNAAQQQWAIEGIAEFTETYDTTRGRGRSPFIDMYLRTVTKEDEFASIDKATYWYHKYPYGNTAYWYGIGFLNFLREKYGPEKIFEFQNLNASTIYPFFFNFKTDSVFQKSFTRLWDEWRVEQKQKWSTIEKSHSPQMKTTHLLNEARLAGRPVWGADGSKAYASIVKDSTPQIVEISFDQTKSPEPKKILEGKSSHRLSVAKNHLFYTESTSIDRYRTAYDLFAYDLEKKKSKRLTKALRIRDFVIFENSVIAVRVNRFKSEIIRFNFDLSEDAEKRLSESDQMPAQYEVLYQATDYQSISKPVISKNGDDLVFSMKVENQNRDLYRYQFKTKEVTPLTQDAFEDQDPEFSEDGQSVYFSSARPLGSSETLVPNIYRVNVGTLKIDRITDTWTGALTPAVFKDKLLFGHFHSFGNQLELLDLATTPSIESGEGSSSIATTSINENKAEPSTATESDYSIGSTLLPRYLFPILLYTDSDSIIGAQSGSRDPLGRHMWSGVGYYFTAPQRPGGALTYVYDGISGLSLFVGGAAGITNYGSILYRSATRTYTSYYERSYRGFAGFSHQFWMNDSPTGFSISQSFFLDHRAPLLAVPSDVLSGLVLATGSSGIVYSGVLARPETGPQWGFLTDLTWSTGVAQDIDGISPNAGQTARLSIEYSPKAAGSEFSQLITVASAKTYHELTKGHHLAARLTAGVQWLDPLYQRTFRLGGSLGEGPLASTNRRSFNIRGLPSSTDQGEGALAGSLEYRFRVLKEFFGMGTAPIWLKNLSAGVFSDFGQVFQRRTFRTLAQIDAQKFSFNRFSQSVGGELRSDVSLFYAPPLTLRLGYGYVLFLLGDQVISDAKNQVYFELGTSF